MRWGLGVDLTQKGGQLARAARIYCDLVEEGGDVDEIDEAVEMLEYHLEAWWQAVERFRDSASRELNGQVAEGIARRIRNATNAAAWNPRRQIEDERAGGVPGLPQKRLEVRS